jgi:GDP-D-mannose dehydratase
VLGWKPQVQFKELIEMMVESDLKALQHTVQRRMAIAGD